MDQFRYQSEGLDSAGRIGRGRLGSRSGRDRRPSLEPLESRRLLTSIAEYATQPVNMPSAVPSQIATGSDGNLWFTELGANRIAMVHPNDPNHSVATFPLGQTNTGPLGITAGPDTNGNQVLWFTESIP